MKLNCKKCDKGFSRTEPKFPCNGVCGRSFHMNTKCLPLTEYDIKLISTNKNIKFMCDDCNNCMDSVTNKLECVLKVIYENKQIIEKQEEEIKLLLESVREIKEDKAREDLKKANERAEPGTSYAEQVKKTVSVPVIVKPKTQQDSRKTKNEVKEAIDPKELSLKISGVTSKQGGAIAINCGNQESVKIVEKEVKEKLGDKYTVKPLVLRKPKVVICELSEKLEGSEVVEAVKKQNNLEGDIKFVKIYEGNKKGYNVILEVDTANFYRILGERKLNVGWDRCPVYECLNVKRCFKCWGYNHEAKVCGGKKMCPKCMGEHDVKECVQDELKCGNCEKMKVKLNMDMDAKHDARSRDCPVYMRKLKVERESVKY